MKLEHVQRHLLQYPLYHRQRRVYKQTHGAYEGRQGIDNGLRLADIDCARATGVKHQAYGIDTRIGRRASVLGPGYPADLDTRGGHNRRSTS